MAACPCTWMLVRGVNRSSDVGKCSELRRHSDCGNGGAPLYKIVFWFTKMKDDHEWHDVESAMAIARGRREPVAIDTSSLQVGCAQAPPPPPAIPQLSP